MANRDSRLKHSSRRTRIGLLAFVCGCWLSAGGTFGAVFQTVTFSGEWERDTHLDPLGSLLGLAPTWTLRASFVDPTPVAEYPIGSFDDPEAIGKSFFTASFEFTSGSYNAAPVPEDTFYYGGRSTPSLYIQDAESDAPNQRDYFRISATRDNPFPKVGPASEVIGIYLLYDQHFEQEGGINNDLLTGHDPLDAFASINGFGVQVLRMGVEYGFSEALFTGVPSSVVFDPPIVPEPTTVALTALGVMAYVARRRRA